MKRWELCDSGASPDRWLVSYSDLLTLLFAVFVVLFVSAYHDKTSVQRVSSAVRGGFQEMGSFSGRRAGPDTVQFSSAGEHTPTPAQYADAPTPRHPAIDTRQLQQELTKTLGTEIRNHEVVMSESPEGFVISLREMGFFASGQDQLLPGASEKLNQIAALLERNGLSIRVEGHSDNVPIHNASFKSNWELSTARAMTVGMMLIDEAQFDPSRVSIAGYGKYHPVAGNDTPEGRRANRRVDIVVLSAVEPSPRNSR